MSQPGRLFDPDDGQPTPSLDPARADGEPDAEVDVEPGSRLVRVLPDVSGLTKEFDYVVPARWADRVTVGSMVRIDLHGRRVAGWVVATDVEPKAGLRLRSITKVSSVGPPDEIIELARWAARRWAGRVTPILKTASPHTMVGARPSVRPPKRGAADRVLDPEALDALDGPGAAGVTVVRVSPTDRQWRFAESAAARGNALIVVPGIGTARRLSGHLGRLGHRVHLHPGSWAGGFTGGVVVGSRSAVWAPAAPLDAVVVLDEHDEALQEERNPTWHARDVAIERARRAGVPTVLVSPAPSLVAVDCADRVLTVSRAEERRGWPAIDVVDRRAEEPGRTGLFSSRATSVMRSSSAVVAVLNRRGRAQMLACASCGELVKTEDGEHLMVERDGQLVSPHTGESRPLICAVCTGTTLKRLRLGVTRAAEELERLLGRPVVEISSDTADPGTDRRAAGVEGHPVLLGTEAVLHRDEATDAVVFLDFDQELHAPRYRAAEQAMWLLVRAARMVGGRRSGARIVVQTRSPGHRVLRAAVSADPGRMLDEERSLRRALGFPPAGALAELGGPGAAGFAGSLAAVPGATVLGPRHDGRYLLRADDPTRLADILAATGRPKERVRLAVDPPRA